MSDDRNDIEAAITRFLGRRDYSTGELREKLRTKDFDHALVDQVLQDFVDDGWLDDEAFAEHQARLLADKNWGPIKIRMKLEKHGIPRSLARATVDGLETNWTESARDRIERRFGELARDDHDRAFRHLSHRGYPAAVARRAIFD